MELCKHDVLLNNYNGTLRCASCKEVLTALDLNMIAKSISVELSTGDSCLHRSGGKLIMDKSGTSMVYKCQDCNMTFPLICRTELNGKKSMKLKGNDIIQNIKIYNKNITKTDIYKLYHMNNKNLIMELQVALSVYETEIVSTITEEEKERIIQSLAN